jgi:AcrR family transcriptional regulator
MQEKTRRSNADRSQQTRDALVHAGRELFVKAGYAATGTPEIVAAAAVTRGALYHHFADKADLFEAVIRREEKAVADEIISRTADIEDPLLALEIGTDVYLDAMAEPGRTRLLLIEGPVVLGRKAMDDIDRETSAATLVEGLAAAIGRPADIMIRAQAELLAAAFDRAALEISGGGPMDIYRSILRTMLSDTIRNAKAEQ